MTYKTPTQTPSNMRVLAIDPGFERVGIAVLQKDLRAENLLYSDCFTTSSKDEFPDRLYAISKEVLKIIKAHKPHVLAIEKLFFNTNQKTAMRVAEARGVIINSARTRGLDVFEYTPLQVKIAITGYGKADKRQVSDAEIGFTHNLSGFATHHVVHILGSSPKN